MTKDRAEAQAEGNGGTRDAWGTAGPAFAGQPNQELPTGEMV